jgi:isoleucyl-tRNA synthetase
MSFKNVPNKMDFVAQEHDVIEFWRSSNAFNKMRDIHRGKPTWSFMDGPITANNPMGVHHGWGRTFKDLYNRYWTMQGRELRYQQGFDCQGLWVEVEVEKELGFTSKKDIEAYGLEKFILKCKERVLRFAAVQTEQSKRLGYWMEWNDPDGLRLLADKLAEAPYEEITYAGPAGTVTGTAEQVVGTLGLPELGGSYFTFSDENNYMIWAFLKECADQGWLYRGADSMPWCPRCATAISQHEIVTDGYADLTHPSVTLRFPLRGRERESLLIWTTTPWTLSSNVAAAVGPELDYVKVRQGDEALYLSKGTLKMLEGEFSVEAELKGKEMEGWTYDGPFDDLPAANRTGGVTDLEKLIEDVRTSAKDAHQVILWDDVGDDEGTGIVHIAPGCGKEDFELGRELGFPLIAPLDEEGFFLEEFGWLSGADVKDPGHRQAIFDKLDEKGLLYKVEDYTHRYPTCWRCKTELVFRLVDEWFINMGENYEKPRPELSDDEKANSLRYQIMDVVDQIRWIPEFGHARELDWLRNMHDWMISKKRYWGLALPIWVCDDCDQFEVIGSDTELKSRAVEGWDAFEGHAPHRPFIDAVKIKCPHCDNAMMTRIKDVGNPWLDAGIVSFSTTGFRQHPEMFEKWYPADWISESFPGQFRNWFYSLLAMGTVLGDKPPFMNLFGYAILHAEDGREMHKSWGNSIEFNQAADRMGVDVMRWLYCAHKPENNLLFGYNRADEVRRRVLIPLWNVYSFFTTYANLDDWQPDLAQDFDPAHPEGGTPQSESPLDQWILARLNEVLERVTVDLTNYDAFSATLSLEPFLDDLTNWYVRRSRRRFWRSEQDNDKKAAYATLYHVLVKLARIMAPLTPFVTEVMYQNLVATASSQAYESVHHTSWPLVDTAVINSELVEEMTLARRVASLGLSARSSAGLKVRQPLARVLAYVSEGRAELSDNLAAIVTDELNIKSFEFVQDAGDLVAYRVLPMNKVLGPRFGKDFPAVRTALAALDAGVVAAAVEAGQDVRLELELEGQAVALAADEILVSTEPAEGLAVAADRIVTVAVDSVLTDGLKVEGMAREVVRRIQSQRKDADFNIEDRISVTYSLTGEVADDDIDVGQALDAWKAYIQRETLAESLSTGSSPAGAHQAEHQFGGQVLVAYLKLATSS